MEFEKSDKVELFLLCMLFGHFARRPWGFSLSLKSNSFPGIFFGIDYFELIFPPACSFNVCIQIFFYLWKVFLNCNFDMVVLDRPLTHLLASLVCPPQALSLLSVCFCLPSPLSSSRTFSSPQKEALHHTIHF